METQAVVNEEPLPQDRREDMRDSLLVNGACDAAVTLETASVIEGPGAAIGRYRLLEKIGEGSRAYLVPVIIWFDVWAVAGRDGGHGTSGTGTGSIHPFPYTYRLYHNSPAKAGIP